MPGEPVFIGISRAIQADIRSGRIPGDMRLPGTRSLAARLGVNRSTVVQAIRELVAQGWLRTEGGSGTFVICGMNAPSTLRVRRDPDRLGFDLRGADEEQVWDQSPPSNHLVMAGGVPDTRSIPVTELARAYRRALQGAGHRLLDYGDPRGDVRLRGALCEQLAERRGLVLRPDDLFLSRGSQMALYMLGQVLLRPGDVVVVEASGYAPAWRALRRAGARLVPIEVDVDGLRVDKLAAICATQRVRAVYVTPHHQYPTGAHLCASRRVELLDLAREHGFAVLEDDYDNEFHFDGRPVLPLAAMDRHGVVVYIATLSKAFAPGVRLGWVAAPRPVLRRMAALRRTIDRQGDRVVERAIAHMLDDGSLVRHVARMQRQARERRQVLLDSLQAHLPGDLVVRPCPGGLSLWARVADGLDADDWVVRAHARRLTITSGRHYAFDRAPSPWLRLGFACLNPEEIEEGVRRLRLSRPPYST